MSVTIINPFLTQIFFNQKLAEYLRFRRNGVEIKILYSEPPKGTSFDVLVLKIGAGVLAVGCRKDEKN